MVIRVDDIEPNIFPAVETTHVVRRPDDQGFEVVLLIRIDGKATRIRIRLDRAKALQLRGQLESILE
jgi:hypothetical protein